MKNLLIIKTGDTFPEIKAVNGDFEDMFTSCLEGIDVNITVYDARGTLPLPELSNYSAVIITGSHSMVTDCEPWSERLLPFITAMHEAKLPTLGVCYGHQLIAKALGGEIGLHPHGPQAGSTDITLTEAGKQDQLLGLSPEMFKVNAGNSQRVTELPAEAVALAGNDFEPHQAVKFGEVMWGLQFHPEFNRQVTYAYISCTDKVLRQYGRDAKKIKSSCIDTPESRSILQRFSLISSIASSP